MTFEGFEAANTTPVPDILFDELLSDLTGAELKVLLYIIRRTRGFKKDTDAISLTQLQGGITTKDGKVLDKGCGIKRRDTIVESLTSLEKKNCITVKKGNDPQGDKATTIYGIKFKEVVTKPDYPSNITGLPVVTKPDYRSHQTGLGVVTKPDSQETVIQQTVKQDTEVQEVRKEANASPPPFIKETLLFPKEEKPVKLHATNGHKPEKPKSELEKLTQQEQAFWFIWLNVDQNKKVKPALKPSAIEHIQALAPHVTTQEQIDSLTIFARQKTRQELKQPELWHIELGNLRRQFAEWDRHFSGATNGTGAATHNPERSHNLLPELQAAKVKARNYRKSAEIRRKRGDIAGAEEAEQDAIEFEAEVKRLSQQEQQIA